MVKVIFPTIIRVEPKVYNVLRSFLYSSTKDKYSWNIGVVLPNSHVVEFVKQGKWILNINHKSAILFDKNYKQVLLVEPFRYILETNDSYFEELRDRVVLTVKDGSYEEVEDLQTTYIIPEPPVPFYLPLPLSQIVDKTKIYNKAFIETVPTDLKCYKECYKD